MLEVDDSELTPEDHEFLHEGAAALRVTARFGRGFTGDEVNALTPVLNAGESS